MSQFCLPDLRQTRARVFFWLGLLILPIFWIGWMNGKWFSRRERMLGWTWTAMYSLTAVTFHAEVAAYCAEYFTIGHAVVALAITAVLLIWLLGRSTTFPSSLLEVVFIFFCLGPHLPVAVNQLIVTNVLAGSPPEIWILPMALAVLHLLTSPDWGGLRKAAC